jgi:hypothetical protein
MAIETKPKDFGDLHVEVTQLPYFAAQRLFVRVVKLLGPALLALVQATGKTTGRQVLAALGDRDVNDLVPVLNAVFEKLEPHDVEALTRQILETTRVHYNGKMVMLAPHMDAIIGGDFWLGLAIQAFALSVHFGNFSSARGAFGALGLKVPSSETSPTSNGSTGDPSSEVGG